MTAEITDSSSYPVQLEIDYPERLSHWKVYIKWLLIIPHDIVLGIYGLLVFYGSYVLIPFAGLAILITGRYPERLWGWYVHYLRWTMRVFAYVLLMTDEYPPFNGKPDLWVLRFNIEYPERMSRWLWLVKWILVIPHVFVLTFLSIALLIVWIIAWWAILFTGHYPRSLFEFSAGVLRWNVRVLAYTLWLRDEYPPFSLD